MCEIYAPDLRRHFMQESVLAPVYLHQWYLTLFVTSLPLGTVAVTWDFFLCTGLHAILPLTLSLMKVLQSFLLRLRFEGIVKFLKSLRSSGDCDESKIGKMLVRQSQNFPLSEKYREVSLTHLIPPRAFRFCCISAAAPPRLPPVFELVLLPDCVRYKLEYSSIFHGH